MARHSRWLFSCSLYIFCSSSPNCLKFLSAFSLQPILALCTSPALLTWLPNPLNYKASLAPDSWWAQLPSIPRMNGSSLLSSKGYSSVRPSCSSSTTQWGGLSGPCFRLVRFLSLKPLMSLVAISALFLQPQGWATIVLAGLQDAAQQTGL